MQKHCRSGLSTATAGYQTAMPQHEAGARGQVTAVQMRRTRGHLSLWILPLLSWTKHSNSDTHGITVAAIGGAAAQPHVSFGTIYMCVPCIVNLSWILVHTEAVCGSLLVG